MGQITEAMRAAELMRNNAAVAVSNEKTRVQNLINKRLRFMAEIAPLAKVMASLLGVQPVRYRMYADPGSDYQKLGEREIMWCPEAKKIYDECQELIDLVGEKYKSEGL